jgi:hypothetical protein
MTENDRLLKNTNSNVRNLRVSFLQSPSTGKKNKIHTIYKQTSVFILIISMLLFWFLLAKQQQQKKR